MSTTPSGREYGGRRRAIRRAVLFAAIGASVPFVARAQEVTGTMGVANVAVRGAPAEATVASETHPTIGAGMATEGSEARPAPRTSSSDGRAPAGDPTAARDLPRGITLTADDIAWTDGPAVTTSDADQVGEGWVTRRVIAAGEPLRAPAVAPPAWVSQGEPVQLLYRVGSVEGRLRGTAMGTAAKGERVLVRIDARRRVEGVVVAPGLVHIQGGIR